MGNDVTTITLVDWKELTVTTSDGTPHKLFEHEFCYLLPSRTDWVPSDGPVSPLSFAMVLHNARKGHGLVLAMEDLLSGITPKNLKRGNAAKAEDLLEEVRKELAPDKPSRLRCHFLNYARHVAEYRAGVWAWETRTLARCYLLLSSGKYHYADVSVFEDLTRSPDDRSLAERYWRTFQPRTVEEGFQLEVLADSALYFPDWEEFPEVPEKSLGAWNETYGGLRHRSDG